MRGLLAISALLLAQIIRPGPHAPPPEACFIAAIATIVDDVRDPKDIKYHRMVVAGIRKLEPAPDALEESCEPRDGIVPLVLTQAAESRLRGEVPRPPQILRSFVIRRSSLSAVHDEIKRFALVARRYSGSFTRVEFVPVDRPEAPGKAELPLPRLGATDAEEASCKAENKVLETEGAKFRWAC